MPRNASGTYSLPSGNPVSAGTLIDATWANNTLNDLANEMTDSLSRSGEGGMLAPFRLADGLQSTPGIAWSNEPSTGFYRAGTNEMWAVVGGTQITQFTSTGMAGRFAAGAVTTPSVTVQGDTNTGIYFPGADQVAIATGGVQRLSVDASGGVSVPGTFSVTGNVTIDTNTLFVDAASNRVGVGTVTPAVRLDVAGGISIGSADNLTWGGAYGATTPAISGAAGFLAFYPNGSTSGEQMRLTSTGLGIGTSSPATKLEVNGRIQARSSSDVNLAFVLNNTASGGREWQLIGSATGGLDGGGTFNLRDNTAGANRLTIDASGNAGLGVTPSAWFANSRVIQMGAGACVAGRSTDATISELSANQFINASGNRIYISTNVASLYEQNAGQHRFFTAPSGTAGNTITFTQAMTLDASGRLGIGETAPATTFNVGSKDHGVGIAYINSSTLPSLAGSYTTSSGWGYGFGDLILKSRTDFGGFYNIIFATASSNNTPVERARISAAGHLLVGTTTISGQGFSFQNNGYYDQYVGDSFAPNSMSTFYSDWGATKRNVAVIRVDGNLYNFNGVYGTLSDVKLKENIVDATPKLESLCKVRVVNYNKIGDSSKHIGVIAQELEQVFPGLVDATPDYDADGNDLGTVTKSVKYSVFVPMLIKAMQEQQSMIEELKSKVAALEAK